MAPIEMIEQPIQTSSNHTSLRLCEGIASAMPLEHQVAGHVALLKLPETRVGKPLIPQELWFYERLNSSPIYQPLLSFIPAFFGTMQVRFREESLNQWIKMENAQSKSSKSSESWSEQMTTRAFSQMLAKGNLSRDYLILEDLTQKYRKPCIFDIKIGTRGYGDDADAEKKRRHILRCETTTSKTLGLRLCGQMVYQKDTHTFRKLNKIEGRDVTTESMKNYLCRFFDDGQQIRTDVLEEFITSLKTLLQIIRRGEAPFRFYSTSLLLIYEGAPDDHSPINFDVKIIDFAHTFLLDDSQSQVDGYAFGLGNLIHFFEEIYDENI
eukprot:TRINITY_DN13101_c0_g1_i1.p1 TRINITY_DN13101_c0_g1~~TRINITY_DN13101_c0_g1_i1.p1  ORF type:complete len:324 (-),score=47.54 TRINITY_DN13101_c0_g1_i1:287-1258(-)